MVKRCQRLGLPSHSRWEVQFLSRFYPSLWFLHNYIWLKGLFDWLQWKEFFTYYCIDKMVEIRTSVKLEDSYSGAPTGLAVMDLIFTQVVGIFQSHKITSLFRLHSDCRVVVINFILNVLNLILNHNTSSISLPGLIDLVLIFSSIPGRINNWGQA